jgi:hypothetical protein
MFFLFSSCYKIFLIRRDLAFLENWFYEPIEAIGPSKLPGLGFGLVPSFQEQEKNFSA